MIAKRSEKRLTICSKAIAPVSGRRPLEADHVGDQGQPLDHRARDPEARPERVVDDEPDVGGAGGGQDVLLEVALGVLEVEGRRDLDVVGADPLGGLGELDELAGARRLAAHRDRDAPGRLVDDRLGDERRARRSVSVEKSPAAPPASRTAFPVVRPPSMRNRTCRRIASRSTARSGSRNIVGIVT